MTEPRWLVEARKHVGLREIAGRRHNPSILRWWMLIHAPFSDDETPWCAGYLGGVLESVGIRSTRSALARSYERYGVGLPRAALGSIAVFWRGSPRSGSGHVGFVIGEDSRGHLLVLGGNQGDAVSIKPFERRRLLSLRWPDGEPLPASFDLQRRSSSAPLSTNEA